MPAPVKLAVRTPTIRASTPANCAAGVLGSAPRLCARAGTTPASSSRFASSSTNVVIHQPRARAGATPASSSGSASRTVPPSSEATQSAKVAYDANDACFQWDWSLTAPVAALSSTSQDDIEHLFEPVILVEAQAMPRKASSALGEFAALARRPAAVPTPPAARFRQRSAPALRSSCSSTAHTAAVCPALPRSVGEPPPAGKRTSLYTPRAVVRSRPKPSASGDCEPMSFEVAYWRARAADVVVPLLAATSVTLEPAAPQSSLSDDSLRELIELSQEGFRVGWPQGLDVNIALAVLRARLASATASAAAAASATAAAAADPASVLETPAVLSIDSSRVVCHPPGLYCSNDSPDGATRGIQTRRISFEETICTAQSSSSFSSSEVAHPASTPCIAQASSRRPEPARAEGDSHKRVTRQAEEPSCAAASSVQPRGEDPEESSSLLDSSPRAGSVPVRGSAGVFGTKNQR